jgi:hypothetical protein
VKNWLQAFGFKCNVYRYAAAAVMEAGGLEPLVALLRRGCDDGGGGGVGGDGGGGGGGGGAAAGAGAGSAEDEEAVAQAAGALSWVAFKGAFKGATAVVEAGALEPLVTVLAAGRPGQSSTAKVAGALGNLAMHAPLRATMRRAGVFHPMVAKLDATGEGTFPPFARYQGLAMVAMLYGEDSSDEAAAALLSRHDVSRLAVAALRAALAGLVLFTVFCHQNST